MLLISLFQEWFLLGCYWQNPQSQVPGRLEVSVRRPSMGRGESGKHVALRPNTCGLRAGPLLAGP